MIKFKNTHIIVLVISLFLGILGAWYLNNFYWQQVNSKSRTNQVVVIGVIRTSGLKNQERIERELADIKYQITDFGNEGKNNLNRQVEGYFLLSNNLSDDLLGKCARVIGTVSEKITGESYLYNRLPLEVIKLEKIDNSNCSPYSLTEIIPDKNQEKQILQGIVIHSDRPAPEINYDYQLKLLEPQTDKSGSSFPVSQENPLYIVPLSDVLWLELENNIGKEVIIEGYWQEGYKELKYLQVVGVKNSRVKAEEEIRSLIAKFEGYIKERNVEGLMSLYTSAKTEEEIASYRNMMGLDPNIGRPRLFNNVSSNFIVADWEIVKIEPVDKDFGINDRYLVTVKESRKSWCNAGPCAGTYSPEEDGFYVFEVVKEKSVWLVDKYYHQPTSPEEKITKYDGLNF